MNARIYDEIVRPDRVNWARLIVMHGAGNRLVVQPDGITKLRWHIGNWRHLTEHMTTDGMMIIDIPDYMANQLHNIVNQKDLRDCIGHRVGTIVLHGRYNEAEDRAVEFTIKLSELDSVVHVLAQGFFDSDSFRRFPYRNTDAWNTATRILAGFAVKMDNTVPFIDETLLNGVPCWFDEIIWLHNHHDSPYGTLELIATSFPADNIKEKDQMN